MVPHSPLFCLLHFFANKNLLQLHQFCHAKRATTENKNIYYNIEISYMQLQAHKHKYLDIITAYDTPGTGEFTV